MLTTRQINWRIAYAITIAFTALLVTLFYTTFIAFPHFWQKPLLGKLIDFVVILINLAAFFINLTTALKWIELRAKKKRLEDMDKQFKKELENEFKQIHKNTKI